MRPREISDTGMFVYDKTVYTVDVELFYDENFAIFYTITADPIGTMHRETGDGKPEKLEFVNTHAWQPCYVDTPVQKNITGNPPVTSVFTFTMEANDAAFPMPAGSVGGVKTVSIAGRGAVEFGIITFTEPGVYEYTIRELYTRAYGYTYDTTIYTIRFTVTEQNGQLVAEQKIFRNGNEADAVLSATFTNQYRVGGKFFPITGDGSQIVLWCVVGGVSLAAIAAILILLKRRKKQDPDETSSDE